jgi:hypothetical protein
MRLASVRIAGVVSQLGEGGTSMAGVDTEVCQCFLPSDTAQNDLDALVKTENEDSGEVPIRAGFNFSR